MNNRGFYVAAAIFLVAIGAFYFLDIRKPPASGGATPQATPVISVDAATVTQFQVKTGGRILTVTRNGSDWRYSVCPTAQPDCPSSPADATRSITLLQAILQLQPTRTIFGAPEGLPAYGLDTATRGEIDIATSTGQTIVVLIGSVAPDNASVYLRLSTSNDILAVASGTLQTEVLGALDAPPAVVPTPSPAASASPATSAAPSP